MISPELLRRHTFFSPFNDRQLKALAMISEEENLGPGQTVLHEGHPADYLFFLLDGSVDLYVEAGEKAGPKPAKDFSVGEVNPGEPFGLSALTEPYIYTTTARVSKPSRVIRVDAPALRDLCVQDLTLAYPLIRQIASAALQRLNATRVQLAAARA